MLKPQDIVILLKMFSIISSENTKFGISPSQNNLASRLCMSASEVNAGINRLCISGLLGQATEQENVKRNVRLPIRPACEECLISGVKYFFPVQLGAYTKGIATSYAAPIFESYISVGNDPIPVWPYGEGDKRGFALKPLYSSVPYSLAQDPDPVFYELLVLIDAIRSGRARERNITIKLLRERINYVRQA